MVTIGVQTMRNNFLKTNPTTILPKFKSTQKLKERLKDISLFFQNENIIKKIGEPPETNHIKKIEEYWNKHKKLVKKGFGKEELISKLEDYQDIELIIKKVHNIYKEKPRYAGMYAHKYIAYNPFVAYQHYFDREYEEPQENQKIKLTEDTIKFSPDLLAVEGLYEFKLTTAPKLAEKLKEALIQLYLYDFIFRIKYKQLGRHENPLFIEIYCVDLDVIYQFGSLFPDNFMIEVNTDVLKNVFKVNKFSQLDKINYIIDDIYNNLIPATIENDWKILKIHKYRDVNAKKVK